MDRAFNPQSVAVVGDSRRNDFEWLRGQSSFQGRLYSVQVNSESANAISAMGIANYTSLLDIPEPIDLAIVAVPRAAVLGVLEDCIRKEVTAVHVFTSGFSEAGTADGIELGRLIATRAEQANLHVIGPNCMGIFNPAIGLRQSAEQYTSAGGMIGFIAQSGGYALTFSLEAHLQGIDINKSVSFGNGTVLDFTEFLRYLGSDPAIKAIGVYLEGVKDGRAFLKVLREVSPVKPIVMWKGGRTTDGARAIASHTGALAMSQDVWDAAMKQCGAIQVSDRDELIDTLKCLIYLPPIYGDRVTIAGGSGGHSVTTTDAFVEAGLSVPPLTQQSYDELAPFFDVPGGSYKNPIDTAGPVARDMSAIMGILGRDPNIDIIVLMISTKPGLRITADQIETSIDLVQNMRTRTSKPVMVVVSCFTPDGLEEARRIGTKFQQLGVPAFTSAERAALALRKTIDYHRFLKAIDIA